MTFEFTCGRCGEVHRGSPSFGYAAPHQYDELDADEMREIASLADDFCVIEHPEQTDRFVRTVLEVPIDGVDEPFLWGVWISLSESNYENYRENFESEEYEDVYSGWFCNRLPYYPDTLYLKARAFVRPGGGRPSLELEPTDHPLAVDSRRGIPPERAADIFQVAVHGAQA